MFNNLGSVLILSRFFIGISIFLFAKNKTFRKYFPIFFILGFVADFLDCKLGFVPFSIGILDGYADIILYLSSIYFLWSNYPEALRKWRYYIIGLVGLFLLSWLFCLLKFGKLTCYHPYSAKLWGASIFLVIIEIAIFHRSVLFPLVIIFGLLNNLEEISITYVMPYYKIGVRSLNSAIKLKREYKMQQNRSTNIKLNFSNSCSEE